MEKIAEEALDEIEEYLRKFLKKTEEKVNLKEESKKKNWNFSTMSMSQLLSRHIFINYKHFNVLL